MPAVRIVMPATAKAGDILEIKTLIQHVMENGFRRGAMGEPLPRHIIDAFRVTYDGEEIFRAELFPAVSANPYFLFTTRATRTGELVFSWHDDTGETWEERRTLTVA